MLRRNLAVTALVDEDESLYREDRPYRNDHAAARPQLLDKRLGNVACCSGDDDRIKRGVLGPPEVAVPLAYVHIVVAETFQALPSGSSERLNDLNGVDLIRDFGEYCGLIAASGPHFEDDILRIRIQDLGHVRDNVGLRDRLAVTDRKRSVGIRLVLVRGRYELVPRGRAHSIQDRRMLNAGACNVALYHPATLVRPFPGRPGVVRLGGLLHRRAAATGAFLAVGLFLAAGAVHVGRRKVHDKESEKPSSQHVSMTHRLPQVVGPRPAVPARNDARARQCLRPAMPARNDARARQCPRATAPAVFRLATGLSFKYAEAASGRSIVPDHHYLLAVRINMRDPRIVMLTVLIGCLTLAAVAAAWFVLRPRHTHLDAVRDAGTITMITQNSQHAYYLDRGAPAGFEYELAAAFADFLGVELNVTTPPWSSMVPALLAAEGDFIAAAFTNIEPRRRHVVFSEPYMIVRQHLIVHASDHGVRRMEDMFGMTVHVREGTSYERRLRELKAGGLQIDVVAHRNRPTEDLIRAVAGREIQATVADTHVARLNRRYYPDVRMAFAISGPQPLAWAAPPDAEELVGEINQFFRVVKESGLFDRIYDRYYGNTEVFDYVDIKVFHERIRSRLPEFEVLIRREAQKHGFDWRLIAALAYQESHYHPLATSYAGARGLMQLTRTTALEMGIRDRYDPAQSIRAGVEYLATMHERFDTAASERDRLLLAMASYNVGYGHVLDAQAIAREKGLDAGRWSSLEETLPLLSRPEYYRRAAHGYARGTEPVRYINRILTYYDILRRLAPSEEEHVADGNGTDADTPAPPAAR